MAHVKNFPFLQRAIHFAILRSFTLDMTRKQAKNAIGLLPATSMSAVWASCLPQAESRRFIPFKKTARARQAAAATAQSCRTMTLSGFMPIFGSPSGSHSPPASMNMWIWAPKWDRVPSLQAPNTTGQHTKSWLLPVWTVF